MKPLTQATEDGSPLQVRRAFLRNAAAGTVVSALGGYYVLSDQLTRLAHAETRPDGKQRIPPGQRLIDYLKPMGGSAGNASRGQWRLKVHGEVERPFEIDFKDLLAMKQQQFNVDVHCVTGWSLLGSTWTGVAFTEFAARAGIKDKARYVIFEAAHGYTANVPLAAAMAPSVFVAHEFNGKPLPVGHGAPVRNVLPDRYFWKSAKWLTGIRFVVRDEPGYWETRGYSNSADPWREERYA